MVEPKGPPLKSRYIILVNDSLYDTDVCVLDIGNVQELNGLKVDHTN